MSDNKPAVIYWWWVFKGRLKQDIYPQYSEGLPIVLNRIIPVHYFVNKMYLWPLLRDYGFLLLSAKEYHP